MQFIPATEAHFQGIANLVPSAEELYLIYPSAVFPLDLPQLTQLMRTRKELTVIIQNKTVIAFANLYQVKQNRSAFIGNVVVSHTHRGLGIGKALTLHMANICKEKYNATAHLSVFSFNSHALLTYSKLGFQPYAVEQRNNLNKKPVALIHMKLQ